MENYFVDVRLILNKFCKGDASARKLFQPYLAKEIWTSQDRHNLLSSLSLFLLSCSQTSCIFICKSIGPLTVDLLHRCSLGVQKEQSFEEESIWTHERICIVLSWLSVLCIPSIPQFTVSYLEKNGEPFKRLYILLKASKQVLKKRKKMMPKHFEDVLEATYKLMMFYPSLLTFHWQWSVLIDCLKSRNEVLSVRGAWFLRKILSCKVGLCSNTDEDLHCEENNKLMLNCQIPDYNHVEIGCERLLVATKEKELPYTENAILSSDLSLSVVAVCGVLLQRMFRKEEKENVVLASKFVITETSQSNIQSLAIAISERKAVLLEGPVGCGKTALVEHLATITGHESPPFITKVQLSDDTDSKTLTGTYVCTNIPGEFVWQPGILVQACRKGYWVLLEDIDRAPMDVISLLLPLMESGNLCIPGHDDENINVSSGFHLFMTRRTNSSASSSSSMNMLLKHTRTIKLDAIPEMDLKQIIILKYPNLIPIVDKLLTIYKNLREIKDILQYSAMQRKPSTRDLLKWCFRVSAFTLSSGSSDISTAVAMAAIDCFVASCPRPETRLDMIEEITTQLNLTSDKAEYYCYSYKPDVAIDEEYFKVGHSSIARNAINESLMGSRKKQPFAATRHANVLLERIASCVGTCEPVLLVGETGVGKTSALQYLAQETGHRLHVVNMSQQSSSSDLLGGYKPTQLIHLVAPVREEFEKLFPKTFLQKQNQKFLAHVQTCFCNKRYNDLWQLMMHTCKSALKKLSSGKKSDAKKLQSWKRMMFKLDDLRLKLKTDSPIAFNFVEGKLSQCIKQGDWLLLDEINLASSDTLECLSGVLESESGSIVLMERGDAKPITRHNDFRLFAAMNPATDVGKRNLSEGVQNRFTEIFVDEPIESSDLSTIVDYYLKKRTISGLSAVGGIVTFYKEARRLAKEKLVDGAGRKPHYSLRTLCRALRYVVDNSSVPLSKALYEGFCLSFLTALDRSSHPLVINLIVKHIVGKKNLKSILSQALPKPDYPCVTVEGHHIRCGELKPHRIPHYIITPSVKENLRDLSSPVSYAKYPILVQGETSTGKTSLIKYLASATGNKVIRINNHEHTDLQEYVGCYASDRNGKLVFQDGPLVTAMRQGYWIILDELNLAPTDILEALNRVLDDNRELFITETQEVVQAHPRFTLFATQNPPGLYGGRKVLSRAFRNRFVELHFDEIPTDELKTILNERCALAPSHCSKLVKVMLELQARRRASGLFSGKHGFMTLRDLFRWAERHRRHQAKSSDFYDWEQHLVDDGFLLLAGKVRKEEEEKVIEEVLEKHFGRSPDHERLFGMDAVKEICESLPTEFDHVVWTQPMRRLFITLEKALRFDEPVLLVGDTGGGKTTACQMISALSKQKLAIVNCHANTEAADFIGGLRPARHNEDSQDPDGNNSDEKYLKLFEWVDGPLVTSMSAGSHILVDEISLADDSVLERLNSVLEPERTLVIPDKASLAMDDEGSEKQFVVAQKGFQFLATMNPGGDYGKKELSPALRNRMTEIWCSAAHKHEDLTGIVEHNLHLSSSNSVTSHISSAKIYSDMIVAFVKWFKSTIFGKRFVISVRDLITWSKFMSTSCHKLDLPSSYVHAACLVYVDGLGSGLSGAFASQSLEAHSECLKFIISQLVDSGQFSAMSDATRLWIENEVSCESNLAKEVVRNKDEFGIVPFTIKSGPAQMLQDVQFFFNAHTTSANALRVLRALQLARPVLLEGSPGGGKTSLVAAVAKAAGYNLIRINLSEQTDASDLFGADLPVENGKGGEFSWRDGPLLAALKAGHWVVLDELNLASQSVLESLNSVFDHRGELYVPELGRSFHVNRKLTKIFACQNPLQEGGGRKGLPKSFLNRFTQVHVDNLSKHDLLFILEASFPQIPTNILQKMVDFNQQVYKQVVADKLWGYRGSPWEFNLRDMTRWCQLAVENISVNRSIDVGKYVYLIYCERLRCSSDKEKIELLFEEVFLRKPYHPTRYFHMDANIVQIGNSYSKRKNYYYPTQAVSCVLTPSMLHPAESLLSSLNMKWPCILTGGSGSGKSLLVKAVASLVGRKLRVLSTNSSMDTVELLGGYEQSDQIKTMQKLIDGAIKILLSACHEPLSFADSEQRLTDVQNMLMVIERLGKYVELIESRLKENTLEDTFVHVEKELNGALQLAQNTLSNQFVGFKLQDILNQLKKLRLQKETKGTYEWSDSILVKALKEGDWLLVDGANYCSASVLDRLNALLEPNGVLTVTERGVIDGSVAEIKPHEDFRLIFALDPFYGELSRAMRNRCVEIHLPSGNDTVDEHTGLTWREIELINKAKCTDLTERSLCRFLPQDDTTSADNFAAKLGKLSSADTFLEKLRHGLFDQELLTGNNPEQHASSTVSLYPPCVRDFVVRPSLSMIMRQVQGFQNLKQLSFPLPTALNSFFRVFIELATHKDYTLRKLVLTKLILPAILKAPDDVQSYALLFNNAIDVVFKAKLWRLSDCTGTFADLPWDPRWSLQFLQQHEVSNEETLSVSGKHMLRVIFVLLKFEEDSLNIPVVGTKKRFMKSATMFQMANAFSTGKININDMPHSSLAFLFPLFKLWGNAVNGMLLSSEAKLEDESQFVVCEGSLRRISYIWKQFMKHKFSLSTLTNWYLYLKKEMSLFVLNLSMSETDLWRKVEDILENLDKSLQIDGHFEKEYKLQNKILSSLIGDSVDLFLTEAAYMIHNSVQALLRDVLNYTLSVMLEKIDSAFPWSELCSVFERLFKIHRGNAKQQVISRQNIDEENEMDVDEQTDVLQEIETLSHLLNEKGVKLSFKTLDMLSLLSISADKDVVINGSNTMSKRFDISLYNFQLWPIADFVTLMSELNTFSCTDVTVDAFELSQTENPSEQKSLFFKTNFLLKESRNPIKYRSYLLTKILGWPYQRIQQDAINNASASEMFLTGTSNGIRNLMNPFLTENVCYILYNCSDSKIPSQCTSLTLIIDNLWDRLRVPLYEVSEKVSQLKYLSRMLWLNATMFSQIPMHTFSLPPQLLNFVAGLLQSLNQLVISCRNSDNSFFLICNQNFDAFCEKLSKSLRKYANRSEPGLDRITDVCSRLLSSIASLSCKRAAPSSQSSWLTTVMMSFSNCVNCVIKTMESVFDAAPHKVASEKARKEWILTCWRQVGEAWTWTGYFQMLLVSPRSSVDPIERKKTKMECLSEELEQRLCDVEVRNESARNLTGHGLVSEDWLVKSQFCHPRVEASLHAVEHLQKKIANSENKTVFRPSGSQFYELSKDCLNFLSTVGSSSSITSLIKQLLARKLKDTTVKTEDKLQHSFSAFMRSLDEKYSAYPDFIKPIQDAVSQVRFGLGLIRRSSEILVFHKKQEEKMNRVVGISNLTVEKFLYQIITGNFNLSDVEEFIGIAKSLPADVFAEEGISTNKMLEAILSTSLLRLHNAVISNEEVDYESVLQILETIIGMWNKRQDALEQKEAEKASLFKYKAQVHEMNEEEEMEEEFKSMFPTFHEDVADLRDTDDINGSEEKNKDTPIRNEDIDLSGQIYDMAALVHADVVLKWKNMKQEVGIHALATKPVTKKYKKVQNLNVATKSNNSCLSTLFSHRWISSTMDGLYSSLYGSELDHDLIRSHLIACSKINEFLDSDTVEGSKKEAINIYVEASPSEAGRCLAVLKKMRATVFDQLLAEWPDHPVLNILIAIIDRIMSFSVTFPIMKFVTGLELLLEKAQEWEANASRHVSLANHLESVTRLILDWRRLELKSWNKLLDNAQQKASTETTKWWFYIYQLVEDCLRKSDDRENYPAAVCDVISSLQKFIESSTIGQYEYRVNLMNVFYNHCLLKDKEKDLLCTALFNLYRYHAQFLEPNRERVEALRKPIEKELKNYIKIAKWNDINFYVVQNSVTKTHRTLFKFVKKFSSALVEAVNVTVFKSSAARFSSLPEGSQSQGEVLCKRWKELCDASECSAIKPKGRLRKVLSDFFGNESSPLVTEIQRLPTILSKLNRHRSSWLKECSSYMPDLLCSVEETISSIIENFKILRALEPTTPTSKDEELQKKRLSEAKYIQARKRRALSELFKLLRLLGLSYRKGLVWEKTFDSKKLMLSTPSCRFDIPSSSQPSAALNQLSVDAIESSNNYFYKIISRLSFLMLALTSPNKEVGGANNSRISGFTNHLLRLALDQRRHVAKICKSEKLLGETISVLQNCLIHECAFLPLQQEVWEALFSGKKATDQWLNSLFKFKELCQSSPNQIFENSDGLISVTSQLTQLPKVAFCSKSDAVSTNILTSIQNEIDAAEKIKTDFTEMLVQSCDKSGKRKRGLLLLRTTLRMVHDNIENLHKNSEKFYENMTLLFDVEPIKYDQSLNKLTRSPLLTDIIEGKESIEKCYKEITGMRESIDETYSNETALKDMQSLLRQVMVAVQNLVKNSEGIENFHLTDDGLYESHLVKHIIGRMEETVQHLDITKVQWGLLKVIERIKSMAGCEHNKQVLSVVLHSLLPVLEEYHALVSQALVTSALVYRSTCKLTFVLTSIFSEVVNKGFCPPAEFEEELAGDKGELKDVEDAGMGEGEGKKDVSDQIEEESQIEDTPGTEPQEQDDKEIQGEDNAIEMSNDFDGNFQDDAPMDENEESDQDEEEEDLDKQMGDLGKEDETNKLDERMWGSDDEEDDEEKSNDTKEEKGAGMDAEQSELVAKDEEVGDSNKNDELEKQNVDRNEDESEFDPNERDDVHEHEPNEPPQPFELPEDFEMDEVEDNREKEELTNEENGGDPNEENEKDEITDAPDNDDKSDIENTQDEEKSSDDATEEEETKDNETTKDPEIPEPSNDNESDDGVEEVQESLKKPHEEESEEKKDTEEEDANKPSGPGTQLPQEDETPENEQILDKTSRLENPKNEEDVIQCENANEQVSQQSSNEAMEDEKSSGTAPSTDQSGHDSSNLSTQNVADNNTKEDRPADNERKVGQSDSKRSLEDSTDCMPKRLKLLEELKENEGDEKGGNEDADLYQHISEDVKKYDKQSRDAATDEQVSRQPIPDDASDNEDIPLDDESDDKAEIKEGASMEIDSTNPEKPLNEASTNMTHNNEIVADDVKEETEDDSAVDDLVEEKDLPMSSVHSSLNHWEASMKFMELTPEEIAKIRLEMEEHLRSASKVDTAEAEAMWHQYQSVTQPLSQQLSEQLRLILEPTRAAKLKGDYRSGKRLNMRKVIPYIASGFRKDKIWLRRSKPSKREYQIMVAIDDSSSMADNHTKQLAFESLAVISTALTTLEAGQLAVCNFGEDTQLLHDFSQPFTDQSGASVLQQCSFEQDQTKIARLLNTCVRFLKTAQANYTSSADPRLSQLLLIISDGRGLYIEGKENVEAAVRLAKDAGIFLAFVILDNPTIKDSILDIKVPVFKESGKIEIRSYMADFPFPFYVIIRNINALPETLSEALRQWFEIVTSGD